MSKAPYFIQSRLKSSSTGACSGPSTASCKEKNGFKDGVSLCKPILAPERLC